MRQPVISILLAGGILVAAIVPFFDIKTGAAGVSTFPDGIESKEAFLILDKEFSAGEVTPADIVIDGDISSSGPKATARASINSLRRCCSRRSSSTRSSGRATGRACGVASGNKPCCASSDITPPPSFY